MNRCLFALMILALGFALTRPLAGQDLISGVDLMYPEFAHPERDAAAAIQRRDFRFIAVDRARTIVPGMERSRRLQLTYGTKYIRQRLRLFATTSQNFSYNLRARAYAAQYNLTLATYLRAHPPKK